MAPQNTAAHTSSSTRRRRSRVGRRAHGAKCLYCGKRHGDGAPFWNAAKQCWSVVVGRGPSVMIAKGWDGHDKAINLWLEQRVELAQKRQGMRISPLSQKDGEQLTVEELCDLKLDSLKAEAERFRGTSRYKTKLRTLERYQDRCRDLCDHPTHGIGSVTVAQMRVDGIARIKAWVNAHSGWKNGLALVYSEVKAIFNHAAKGDGDDSLGLIDSSPITRLNTGRRRARTRTRQTFFSKEQAETIIAVGSKSRWATKPRWQQFATAFRLLLETGCRPEEFCSLTAEYVLKDEHDNLYWHVEHKNQDRPGWDGARRPVYLLTKWSIEVTLEAKAANPTGSLFRNSWNRPWTVARLEDNFREVRQHEECRKLRLDEHQNVGKRREYSYVPYTCRHTFAKRWLEGFYGDEEASYAKVASLMGNTAAEVERTYGKIRKGSAAIVSQLKSKMAGYEAQTERPGSQ